MLRLDVIGILLSLFFLGPKNWRWSLAAAGVAWASTLLLLLVWKTDLVAYTMGGLFTHIELAEGSLVTLLAALAGPFVCYAVARLTVRRPMGEAGWWNQILPWSELENPMAGTFAKYALLAALFALFKSFS